MYILTLAFILLLFSHLSLRDRVKRLERGSTVVSEERSVSPLPLPSHKEEESFTVDTITRHAPAFGAAPLGMSKENTPSDIRPSRPSPVVEWFKEQTLIKVGGFLFFLGAAWFVSYAINEGWLPPSIRVMLGFALALATYALAYQRSVNHPTHYLVLTALASAILTVSALAGATVFALYPPMIALSIVAAGVAYTAFVAQQMRTEWLIIIAAMAGLVAPAFTELTLTPALLLSYLAVLTGGLLLTGYKWSWRVSPLLLLLGVSWYESGLVDQLSSGQLWLFVCIFSLMFFLSSTSAVLTTQTVTRLDVVTMIITGAWYVGFASVLTASPALATFIATVIVALVGYVSYHNHLPDRVVALYLALAGMGILLGTSFLFSGYSLVLAYAVECTAAFFVATHLGLPERFISILAAVYLLPVALSVPLLDSSLWNGEVWQKDAIAVYAVWAMLGASALWLVHRPGVALYTSSRVIASLFAVGGFFYGYVVIALIADSLFSWPASYVVMYILQGTFSLIVMFYTMKMALPSRVIRLAAASTFIPFAFSIGSLLSPDWLYGIYHASGFGVWTMIGLMTLAILLLTQQYCKEYDVSLRSLNGLYVLTTTLFVFAVLRITWDGLFVSVVADVATYVSYALILYCLSSLFVLVRSPFLWLSVALSGFFFPVLLSLRSLDFSGWSSAELPLQVVGLFAVTTVASLLSLGITKHLFVIGDAKHRETLRWFSRAFGVTAFLLATASVWCIAQSFLAPSEAISTALFVYTVTGLVLYLYGTRQLRRSLRYAGIMLLTVVVLRLLLIDIWQMEMVWRFITLIGVGALFIGAAFFERKDGTQ